MKVQLIDYTRGAVDKLLYTKSTRLEQGIATRAKITLMSSDEKASQLRAMSRTIESSWEFVTYTFEILQVTRAFTHQLVRTRTGSYAQQTMRILPMKGFTYETGPSIAGNEELALAYKEAMAAIQLKYDELLANGAEIEDARGILPTNIHTNIIAQFSLRTACELVKKRVGRRTQGEYRDFIRAMTDCIESVHPWAHEFLFPDYLREVHAVEDLLQAATERILTKEERLDGWKALDKLRKMI